ncbi:phosphate starvation-inducible protein PhoH [Putridiphycobacter roseus]|uniref:PhoH-like protein n=1 Tax=Putridiphycobacter roseus TaxID=2219161 RepID=A0A2W1N3K7_9FLAO|nr:PhoH family protein [Putridiphycobacter roseus]PZE17621.1 phosphate starvation-inducible protein PhoH [Putridiphycobacter roseus]
MQEKSIQIAGIDPLLLFGVNNAKLDVIKKYFPKLKLIARGNEIKILGEPDLIEMFESKIALIMKHINKFNILTDSNIDNLMLQEEKVIPFEKQGEVLLHGNAGRIIKARTANQRKMVQQSDEMDMVFAVGPAGTGKTYTAVALAVRALKNKQVRRIVLTRPAVEAGENLGFLPGDLKEKLDPYLQPLYDGLRDMIPAEKLEEFIENRVVEIAPLAFMRGRTLDNAFVILDEAQNTTHNQMKMFLTRMGKHAKFIITGDVSQIDLPKHQKSGLITAIDYLKDVEGIGIVRLNQNDVIRHHLVKEIIAAFDKNED